MRLRKNDADRHAARERRQRERDQAEAAKLAAKEERIKKLQEKQAQYAERAARLKTTHNYHAVYSGRSQTIHIMKSLTPGTPNFVNTVVTGYSKTTLCNKPATGAVAGIFAVSEATCRECRRRWEMATGQRANPALESDPSYSQAKKGLRVGAVTVPQIFEIATNNRQSVAAAMPVRVMLLSLPGMTELRADMMMAELRIPMDKTVGRLNESQRSQLLSKLSA